MIINYLPEYRKGKSKVNQTSKQFVDKMGPLVYDKMHQMGIYSDRTFDYLMRQLAFESANGTSNVARKYNNYGGVRVPGKTQYQSYKNDQAFVDYWLPMMNRKYAKALKARNIDEYGAALKSLGYYEAPLLQYTAGLKGFTSVGSAAADYATSRNKANKPMPMQTQPVLKPVINLMPDYMKIRRLFGNQHLIFKMLLYKNQHLHNRHYSLLYLRQRIYMQNWLTISHGFLEKFR